MRKLATGVDPRSDAFTANARVNRGLVEELRRRAAEAALGGPKAARERHAGRGKLLPRDRVMRLLDPGAPFLEVGQLAANGMYDDEAPGAASWRSEEHTSELQSRQNVVCPPLG